MNKRRKRTYKKNLGMGQWVHPYKKKKKRSLFYIYKIIIPIKTPNCQRFQEYPKNLKFHIS